jgi:hypothetical protein
MINFYLFSLRDSLDSPAAHCRPCRLSQGSQLGANHVHFICCRQGGPGCRPVLGPPTTRSGPLPATDASNTHAKAVFQQQVGKHWLPPGFCSKKLSKTMVNYSTVDRELLAAISGIKHFCSHLQGVPFQLWTDNKPLLSALTGVYARMWRLPLYLHSVVKSRSDDDRLSELLMEVPARFIYILANTHCIL